MFTNSKNLPGNYAYEKYVNAELLKHSHLPEANYPSIMMYAGMGLGNYMVRDPSLLHANGTDLESYLRGTGSKALERRDTHVEPSAKRVQATLHLDTERMNAIRGHARYLPRNTRDTPYGIEHRRIEFPTEKNHERPMLR